MDKETFTKVRQQLQNAYLETPMISSGNFQKPNENMISVTRAIKNVKLSASTKTQSIYSLDRAANKLTRLGFQSTVDSKILAEAPYKKKTSKKAQMRKLDEGYALEIWENGFVTHHVEVTKNSKKNYSVAYESEKNDILKTPEIHGTFCNCAYLTASPLVWSPDGTKVLYMAEKAKKDVDIFTNLEKVDKGSPFESQELLRKNNYAHNWGEVSFEFYDLEIWVYDLTTKILGKVQGQPEHLKLGFARFLGDSGLTFVGFDGTTFLSGIRYCMNKRSAIYILEDFTVKPILNYSNSTLTKTQLEKLEPKYSTQAIKISEDPIAQLSSPSPDGKYVLYIFSSVWRDSHMFATGFKLYNTETKKTKLLVSDQEDLNEEGIPTSYAIFTTHGYCSNFYKFLESGHVLIPTFEKAGTILNLIDIQTCERKTWRFEFDFETDITRVLDFDSDHGILFWKQNFYHYSTLGYLKDWRKCFQDGGKGVEVIWEEFGHSLEGKEYFIKPGQLNEEKVTYKDVEGHIWTLKDHPTKIEDRPAFLILHGGPHSVKTAHFDPSWNILLNRGFQILNINFSGSWSFGSAFNERLSGHIGELDVEEIMAIIGQLQKENKLTKEKLNYEGGSYSGYLGLVLFQKYPHMFEHMYIRNPVVNMLYMTYATDIPEWCWNEGLGTGKEFDVAEDYTDDQLKRLRQLSPGLQKFDPSSKTKIYLNIGDSDLTIDPRIGFYLYRKLKKLGVDIVCRKYSGGHHVITQPQYIFEITLQILVNCYNKK